MKQAFFLSAALFLGGIRLTGQQNILLIIADDMGKDYCGFYEEAQDTANMPNIRSLLSRGVRFTDAWANPTCSPTRAGLLTGRYSFRTGVGTAISGPGYAQLDTAELTIPRLLHQFAPAPYATANIGKWHLHRKTPGSVLYPNLLGYDHYEGNFLGELSSYTYWEKIKNGLSDTVTNYATTEAADNAIAWLSGLEADQPFFLWLSFNAPHTPFHLPPDSLHTLPGLSGTQMHINQNPKLYFRAMTEAMDTELGRLFLWLQENEQWDSTNVIFIGDNGNPKRVSQIADTSQGKGTLYEYGVNVPFLISGPAVVQPNRVSDALVSTPDLFATILDLAGASGWEAAIPSHRPVDAQSLLPILHNETSAVRSWIFTEQFKPTSDPDDGKAIRNAAYKLLDFDDGHQELYHLSADPLEQNDLLQASLDPEAATNYGSLCIQLGDLLGENVCDTSVTATFLPEPAGIKCRPNPTAGIVRIELPGELAPESQLLIFDALGRLVQQIRPDTSAVMVDLSAQSAGLYYIQLRNGRQVGYCLFSKI